MVSEWRSVIAVSLNVGGGVRLIKPAKLYICSKTCSVTERRRWRPPYQTGKTVHMHANTLQTNGDGRTAPDVCGHGSVPLSHSGNVVTRIGLHTYLNCQITVYLLLFPGKKAIGRTTIQWIVRIL